MKTAFIGLGAMGYPMAGHVSKSHEMIVWNRTTAVAERHAGEYGTRMAADVADCAAADVIFSCLPTSREIDSVVDALAGRLRKGQLWIDNTSGDPESARETACRLAGLGVEYVDAPVTGGTNGAAAGTLTVMVGGSKEGFARALPLIELFGKKIVHVGAVGSGHAIKAMNNVMLAANIWVAGECLLSLKKMGMDLSVAFEVLNAGSGRSFASESLLPPRLVEGKWPLAFKLALLDKDVRIAAETVHEQHLSTPVMNLVSNLYTAARRDLGENADYIEVLKYMAKMSGEGWEG
ncbi:MAG: NAD(P)-dependent oxidoreductase [Thermoanaerobaculia bacterium]|nr:NAD(P)-dependent oxidoreductase [Thermoanaerobaculia bacterium]